jgi:hypothetical protein
MPRTRPGWFRQDCGVYFIACGSFVKIGVGWRVIDRLTACQVGNPYRLMPLGLIYEPEPDVAIATEKRIHERFAEDWHRGEWYRLTPRLRAFIQDVAGPWPQLLANRPRRMSAAAQAEVTDEDRRPEVPIVQGTKQPCARRASRGRRDVSSTRMPRLWASLDDP